MNIVGERCLLRAIEEADLPALHQWANDPETQRMLGGWHFPVGLSDQRRWFEGLRFDSNNQRFAVEADGLGLVGTANLVSIDWQNRTAFHGMMLGNPEVRGKGIARDVVMTVMRYAFEELDLFRLDGDMIEYNVASLKLYTEKCGWRREGERVGWFHRGGRRWNKIIVGVTRDDYRALVGPN